MEGIRRKVKLFFSIYGKFLFKILCGIVIVLLSLRGLNYLYVQNNYKQNEQKQSNTKISDEDKKEIKENKQIIKEFITYCNKKEIEDAYTMLSKKIKEQGYTIEIFNKEIIEKIFIYEKEYSIEKIEKNYFKVIVKEGILETGEVENRESEEILIKIINEEANKKIYIEGK